MSSSLGKLTIDNRMHIRKGNINLPKASVIMKNSPATCRQKVLIVVKIAVFFSVSL